MKEIIKEDRIRTIDTIEIVLKRGIYQVRIYRKESENGMHEFEDLIEACDFLEIQMGYLIDKYNIDSQK